MSKKLMNASKATLRFFEIESGSGEVFLPDADDAKTFVQKSLSPPLELYGQNFQMPMIPLMIVKDLDDLYGYGTPDAQFLRNVHIQVAETVSWKIMDVVWFTRLTCDPAAFTGSFIDLFNQPDISKQITWNATL